MSYNPWVIMAAVKYRDGIKPKQNWLDKIKSWFGRWLW